MQRRESATKRAFQWDWHRLECDYDVSDGGHRIRHLSVDGKVVVLPEEVGFIWLGGRAEGRCVYLGVECGLDDPAHRAS